MSVHFIISISNNQANICIKRRFLFENIFQCKYKLFIQFVYSLLLTCYTILITRAKKGLPVRMNKIM